LTPLGALEGSAFGQAMRDLPWLFPAVKAVHLAGVGLLFGSIAIVDLRLLGFSKKTSIKRLAGRLLPWTAASFLLIVPSGLAMFAAYASDFIGSPVFALKMGLVFAAGINAAVFHAGAFRAAGNWDVGVQPPPAARAAGAVSLLVWLSVIACGLVLANSA
jgi:hypothetical protein